MTNETKFKETEIGMIPEDWEVKEIGRAILINPKRELKKGTMAKKVAMDKLSPFTKKINGFEITEYKGGSKFINHDTLLARITPCLENGKTAYVDVLDKDEVGFGSTEFLVLAGKENKSSNEFVYYLSISPIFRDQAISSMTGTSGRQRVQNDFLSSKKIPLPPLPEQKAIAKTLSDLDLKIELLQKQNKTLEKIGQAIFKHWFVDFEFPNEKGEPYKSSGGKMVESEMGEIPEGWSVGKLGDFGKIICGKTPPKSVEEYFGGETPFIKIPDMHNQLFIIQTEDSLTEKGEKYQKNKTIPANSICVSCIATVGLVSITSQNSQTNQQINSIIPSDFRTTYYLMYYLKRIKDQIQNMGRGGSATLNVNTKSFSNMLMLFPKLITLNKFDKIIKPLFDKLLKNSYQILSLQKTRNLLLPKLMTGKIRVPLDVEQQYQ